MTYPDICPGKKWTAINSPGSSMIPGNELGEDIIHRQVSSIRAVCPLSDMASLLECRRQGSTWFAFSVPLVPSQQYHVNGCFIPRLESSARPNCPCLHSRAVGKQRMDALHSFWLCTTHLTTSETGEAVSSFSQRPIGCSMASYTCLCLLISRNIHAQRTILLQVVFDLDLPNWMASHTTLIHWGSE